jgi:hypothetical protein
LRKPDDSTLSISQNARIQQEAKRILEQSEALGRFPTPVSDIMGVAKITLVPEDVLSIGFVERLRIKAGAALKRAITKVLGLFDAREGLVFIDKSVNEAKQTFLKLHETGHAFLPWQRGIYAVVEDCEKTLDPNVADLFDREANVFATEVLFQLDSFINEAKNYSFGIKAPLSLRKKYGASVYAAVRQYVSKNDLACIVLVLNPPELVDGDGFRATLRRVVASPLFTKTFGNIDWPGYFTPDHEIGAMIPLGSKKMSRPREIKLVDRNGICHECISEAFNSTYNVFILIHAVRPLNKMVFII